MHLRRFEAGDLPAVQELFAGSIRTVCRGIIPRPNWRPGRIGPGASPPSACWTAIPWWQRRRGICWALGTWSRADIWTACIRQRTASAGEWQHRSVTPWKPRPGGRGRSFCGWRLPVLPGAFLSGGGIRWQQPSWCRWMARNSRISAWRKSWTRLFHTKQTHKTALTGETETVRTESADTANANFGEKMKKSRNFLEKQG